MGRLGKIKWFLLGCLIIVLLLLASSVFLPDKLTNTVKWLATKELAGKLRALTQQEAIQKDRLIEMVVESIAVSKIDYQPVAILKEKDGELYLPIWIGLAEANDISVILEGIKVPRPLTPDLLCSTIDGIGASLDHVIINDLQNNIFYASLILNANWTQTEIDARPSDAIATALRVNAPIYATEVVMGKAGVSPERETDDYVTLIYLKQRFIQPETPGQLADGFLIAKRGYETQ